MKTTVEKQVAAFEKLISYCNAHGAMYNPSKASMKVTALNALLTSAQQSVQVVDTAQNALTLAVNARQQIFDPLPKVATRILNSLAATDASPELIADVKMIRDKFRSQASARKPTEPATSSSTEPQDQSRGPLSYLDFETKIRNMGRLIQLLSSEPTYKPNEAELQIAALSTLLNNLKEKHKAVQNAQVAVSVAKTIRKKIVYEASGIHGTALRVKKYIRAAFGATSDQYRQLKGLTFRKQYA
jgi:hypothetical protein